jgi:type I restriction enzyme S subunit
MLPKGWTVIKLSEYVNKIGSGVTPTGGSNTYKSKGIPLIRSQNVLWGKLELSDVAYIDNTQHQKMKSSKVTNGDVLLNITGASIGRAALVFDIDEANVNQHVCIIRTKNELAPAFLKDFLLSFGGQKQIEQFQSGGNRQGLNFEQIGSFKINLPPLPEQIKIAEILSTWDNAINTVQKLLANSQQQKKALMQQLLTGKKRFAGFEGEWEEKRLDEISHIFMGSSPKSEFYNEDGIGLPLLQGNADIKNRKSVPRIFTSQITRECLPDDILLSVRAPVGAIASSNHHACIGRGIAAIRAKEDTTQVFLYQWLLNFEDKWDSFSQGSTFESVNSDDINNLKIKLPSLPEQQKIAAVLTTADQEIDNLRAQLNHLKQEKKALMQQLLTGKRRVKIEEAA